MIAAVLATWRRRCRALAAAYRQRFVQLVAAQYIALVCLVIVTHSSETRAYAFLLKAYGTIDTLSSTLAAARTDPAREPEPDIFDNQHFQAYKLKELEHRMELFSAKWEAETEKIRTNTNWLFGSLVGTMASVLTSTIVYIIVSRSRRRDREDDE